MPRFLACLVAGFSLLAAAVSALAQSAYPNRPVQLIISYGAGSTGDVSMRLLMEQLSAKLGQPFIVINKPGAGGIAAAQAAVATAPDGYTLFLTGNSSAISVALFKSLPYNILTDFAPVSTVANFDMVVVVKAGSPLKSMQDVIAYAKANPGKLNYASQGVGTTSHLTAELFSSITHIKLTHVPYKGTGPALNDIIASHVDLFFTELSTSAALHKAGKARILAVATKQRVAAVPDIPTLAEAGVAGCESDTWNAITAPPKTPAAIVAKLNDAANKALKAPTLLDRYKKLDAAPGGGTPAEMAAFIKQETERWSKVIQAVGIKPE